MICYLDSSVVLRMVLRQPRALEEWAQIERSVSSRLLRLEGFRALDRLRAVSDLSSAEIAECQSRFLQYLASIGLLPVSDAVFLRAEQPLPTPLGSLDSIHLATALFWRELHGNDFYFATHDTQLATAAHAHGLKVIGV